MCTKNHNHIRYRQFLRYGARQDFLSENQNFEKMKKTSADVIILNLCNKKHDHMIYAYSDMEPADIFFVVLGHFLFFYPTIDHEN